KTLELRCGVEIRRPRPNADRRVDLRARRRDAHHFAATPHERAHIGVLMTLLLEELACGGIDLLFRERNFHVENFSRLEQPPRVLLELENLALIGPAALEHAARIVQRMRQDVDMCFCPWEERAVHPNEARTIVERLW